MFDRVLIFKNPMMDFNTKIITAHDSNEKEGDWKLSFGCSESADPKTGLYNREQIGGQEGEDKEEAVEEEEIEELPIKIQPARARKSISSYEERDSGDEDEYEENDDVFVGNKKIAAKSSSSYKKNATAIKRKSFYEEDKVCSHF